MKKIIIILITIIVAIGLTGCTDAEIVSENLSKEADHFRVKRRITFINLRSDTFLFTITGNCSIQEDTAEKQLEVTCKIGEDKYQKKQQKLLM